MKFSSILIFFSFILSIQLHAAKVDTLSIPSQAMGKTYKAAVVLPDSYARGKSIYPVLYLLHGAFGRFDDWLAKTPDKNAVKQLADRYNMIIVMPEGTNFSFYIDSPVNNASRFETYITAEVVVKIDSAYRTIKNKSGRAITGLSMGGHGALYLSGRHPELYVAAGSMSGAVDMTLLADRDQAELAKNIAPVFGPEGGTREQYAMHAVVNMVEKLRTNGLPLIIDCGVNDFLIESNRELHRRLVYAKVPHDYTERPGAHTWEYWENALPYHVMFFSKIFSIQNKKP